MILEWCICSLQWVFFLGGGGGGGGRGGGGDGFINTQCISIAMQQPLCLAWDTMDSGGGASLQIKNAQLKLHFSSCMLVLSFEWMNILQPTLCVILFHAFESSIIFEKMSFYGLSGRPRAVDRFPRGHCFGWLSSNSSYHCKWRRTRLKLYSQSEERTLFRAVCELFWCGLWKQRNGGKYGCCNFFLKYFVKIGRLGKMFTHRLILCSFIYKSMYFTSGFVEKYDGNGLKTMTMWQKNLSNLACASRGFVGLQIKRDGGDLKIQSSSHLSAVKALKLKLNTLTWGIFGWFVYSVRYLVKVYKSLGIVLGTFHPQLLVTPASVMGAPRVLFIGPGFWLWAGLFLQPRGVRYLINAIFLIYIGLDFLKILLPSPIEIYISDFLFVQI